MAAIDTIILSAVDGVKKSGIVESSTLMGTITALADDGTMTVERAGDTYPSVRMLSGYINPAVGDLVEILKTNGGWVCIGKLMDSTAPRIQSGTIQQAGNNGDWTGNLTVHFPKPFAAVPVVTAMPNGGGPAGSSGVVSWQCTSVTTTSFAFRHWRDNGNTSMFGWIATTF